MKYAPKEEPKRLKRYACHGGTIEIYEHFSQATQTQMRFSVFIPPVPEGQRVPVLYWLSGLTCTEENFIQKAGAQPHLAEHGLMLVACDTSPRGAGLEGEDDTWDFGSGAGFYVNATEDPWSKHYNMYDYVRYELPQIIEGFFPADPKKRGIFGHSMGGHGALVLALRSLEEARGETPFYQSVSAFSPICAPSLCPWGEKAFGSYLGKEEVYWKAYDAHHLVQSLNVKENLLPILIDQGTDDEFLREQLLPEVLKGACRRVGYPLTLRMQQGYDHSYYFISTFIRDHIQHHAKKLK